MTATHNCPGCHSCDVPNRYYACADCWAALPALIQRRITRTVRAPFADRLDALMEAAEFYESRGVR